jgi:hypothetical protein
MKELHTAIELILPSLVDEWNTVKIAQCEQLWEKSFKEYFEGRQTQEKTKMIAPILDVVFARLVGDIIDGFTVDEGKGRDYDYNGTPIECKITLGAGNCWVGNGYAKSPQHILMRFSMDENGIINEYFVMAVDLDKCISKWTPPGSSANFSSLNFVNEDAEHLNIIIGNIKLKRKKIAIEMVPA